MWREQPPEFPQLLAIGFLVLSVVVGAVITLAGRDPNRQQMTIFELGQEWADDFNFGAGGWVSPVFDTRDGALIGRVPVGRGHAVATRDVRPANVAMRATVHLLDAPPDAVVSTGIMCRADSNGNGYYFLISSNGRVSIQKGLPNEPDLIPLVDWTTHPAINPLADGNVIRAGCVADYLVMHVNGEYTIQARDDDITRGWVGVALAGNANSANETVDAAFDDITVWEAAARR